MKNRISIKVSALPENVSFIRNAVAAFCVPLNPDLDVLGDIKTAVSEAVTNAIVHGYRKKEGEVEVGVELIHTTVYIKVKDEGEGIADIDLAMQDFYSGDEDGERSGLGFTVMKTFMDTVRVESTVGAGTTVYMTKNLADA